MTGKRGRGKRPGPGPEGGGPSAPRSPAERRPVRVWLYGLHAVAAALRNPARRVLRVVATENAKLRLAELGLVPAAPVESATPRDLDRLFGAEAVHQGVAAEAEPLPGLDLADIAEGATLLLALDQVTDPHNVGAILRSAAAMAVDAVIVTGRHAPAETGVLAKAASGALDLVPVVTVTNLARALADLGDRGFHRIGLDSEGSTAIEAALGAPKIALVLGAEGKGLRRLTRDSCDALARLDLPGAIRSLNVSNAAALTLYLARRSLGARAAPLTLRRGGTSPDNAPV